MALIEAVINSVHAIATGAISGAISWIEKALASAIPVVIGFLARLLGLSGISEKIQGFIKKVQAKVDAAIDKVIGKIIGVVKKLFGAAKAGAKKLLEWWKKKRVISNDGKKVTLYTEGNDRAAKVLVASSPGVPWSTYLANNAPGSGAKTALVNAHAQATVLAQKLELPKTRGLDEEVHAQNVEKVFNDLAVQIEIINRDKSVPASVIKFSGTDAERGANAAEASVLTADHGTGSGPTDESGSWAGLQHLGKGLGKKGERVRRDWYVRGHLLNEHLGGPGLGFNMAPITKRANNDHKKLVETRLKAEVHKPGRAVYYKVTVLAGPPLGGNPRLTQLDSMKPQSGLSPDEKLEQAALRILSKSTSGFKCEAFELEKKGGAWKKGKALSEFTKTIDNKISENGKTYGYHG
jgi:hypothetical protein